MSRLTDDQIMEAMLSENVQRVQESRLDQVAEMVAQMERNLTEKIDQANKRLVDQMQTHVNAPQVQDEPNNNDDGGITNEDNSGSDEQGEE